MADEHEASYGLVMPFVNVKSKGGLFDDDAFVSGYECGHIDGRLIHEKDAVSGPSSHGEP